MGNQIANTPNQILDVKTYFNELHGYEFVLNLGITRLFKVAQAKTKNGYCVVKILQIVDHSLPYDEYYKQNQDIYSSLHQKDVSSAACRNCLPFQIISRNDRAIALARPYIKDNLFYRLQTLPYFTAIEKKWIAYQLLVALKHIHDAGICHGDLKIENILLTSYNWVLLSDFANFKPTYFAYEDPAEYYYYFNASQRNVCYLAPERFYDETRNENHIENDALSTSFGKKGNPSMDIFSVGCILAELFTEEPLFNLTQMLYYRQKGYNPMVIVEKIPDENIREMVASMISLDPTQRRSAAEYLKEQFGKGFPSCFYTFLLPYVQKILKNFSPDYVIFKLHRDFSYIIATLVEPKDSNKENEEDQHEQGKKEPSQSLLILLSLALSTMRKLKHMHSRLAALELLRLMIPLVDDQIVLDRILPYVNNMLNDPHNRVRADAIKTLVFAIQSVKNINQENADLFSVYLFPNLASLNPIGSFYVQSTLAKYLSVLAKHSLRFLETTYLVEQRNYVANNEYFKLYEEELKNIQTQIETRFRDLIQGENDDETGQLAEAVCSSDLATLCTFFGKRKTIEIICGHLMTLLNKADWRIRAALFDSLITVASYIGHESELFMQPILNQGLTDEEEFVVHQVLKTLGCFVRLSLMKRKTIYEFLGKVAPLVCHPNLWLRLGVIHFINSICKVSHIADIHGFVLPVIERFLKIPVLQVDKPEVLYNALIEPLSRDLFDYVQKIQPNDGLFRHLTDRFNIRQMTGSGLKPAYIETGDSIVHEAFTKLQELGMKEDDEDKILALKMFVKQAPQSRLSASASTETRSRPGTISIETPIARKLDFISTTNRTNNEPYGSKNSNTNDSGWLDMFGNERMMTTTTTLNQQTALTMTSQTTNDDKSTQELTEERIVIKSVKYQQPSEETISQHRLLVHIDPNSAKTQTILRLQCLNEIELLRAKQEAIFREDCQRQRLLQGSVPTAVFEITDPKSWSPQGGLLGHVHVHNAKITRMATSLVSPSATYHAQYFVTGDSKGYIRLWDINDFQKVPIFRPKNSIRGPASSVRGLAFTSDNPLHAASLNENGELNIYDLNVSTNDSRGCLYNLKFDTNEVGVPVDIKYFNTGSRDILAFATSQGLIAGIDIRSPVPVFRFKNDLHHRLITALEVDELQSWLAVGTGSGFIDIWDLRFQLNIQGMKHPTGARVISLLRHQEQPNSLISSFQGNNEVAIWNINEPKIRKKVFWPSNVTPLSLTQSVNHYVAAMYLWKNDGSTSLLCSGTDMRIRNWNLTNPARSYFVCRGAADEDSLIISYHPKTIDGVDVTIEQYQVRKHASSPPVVSSSVASATASASTTNELRTPKTSANIPPAHIDTVTGLQIVLSKERTPYLVTSSTDGVVKIWK